MHARLTTVRAHTGKIEDTLDIGRHYLSSLLPLLNTPDILQHKKYVEREIRAIRSSIEREKKKDFIRD